MAGRQHRRKAQILLAVAHAPDAVEIRFQIDRGAGAVALDPVGIVGAVRAHPEIRLGLMHDDLGIGIMRIAGIVDQAIGVIGMQMRHHDVGDRARFDAGGAQIVRQLAERRLHGVAGAGIDHDDLAVAADEKVVDRDIERPIRGAADQCVGDRPLHADDEIERGFENTVADALHLDVAHAHARQCHLKTLPWSARSCSPPRSPRRPRGPRTARRTRRRSAPECSRS